MHMADALLSPAVGTTFWAATLGAIGYVSRRLRERLDDRLVPLMGVLGAFVFAAQMINFTIPGTGSSGHLGGGMLLAAVLGPQAAFLVMASVLTVQALFFADGGLLALGCNIWNLGFYPAFLAYPLIFRPLAKNKLGGRRLLLASLLAATAALQLGAFSVVLQTALSGRSELPVGAFLLLMQPVHLVIGLVEGFVTAGVVGYVGRARPGLLESASGAGPLAAGASMRRVLATFLVLAAFTGGVLSWFASTHPDGLEWAIEKVYGEPELPAEEGGVPGALKDVQDKTAVLPDYGFKNADASGEEAAPSWPGVDVGTSASGLIGALIVLFMVLVIGAGIRAVRMRRRAP